MGTTLEILAPYLPYGIEVEYAPHWTSAGRLTGLAISGGVSVDGGAYRYGEAILPVLYAFDDLTKKTEEHGVLLLKLAILMGKRAMGPFGMYPDHCFVYENCDTHTSGVFTLSREDLETGLLNEATRKALLKLHFAVGLTPDQFIRKE